MQQLNVLRKRIVPSLLAFSILLLPLTACDNRQPETPLTTQPLESVSPPVSGDVVRVGVLAIDSAVSVNERYRPLLDYLEQSIGRPFELVPLSQESQFTEVEANNLEFVTSNPLASVQVRRLYDTQFLVTHSRPKTGAEFSGLIVVKQDSEIKNLTDLKNKKGACVAFQTAAAGCVFQIYHLRQEGIDPFTDFSSFVENPSQDNIVLAVLNGTIDVGFIRTGQLEKMVNRGLIESLDEIRVIDAAEDGFYYQHTTDLYPEWPVAALQTTDPQLATAVRQALLNIPTTHPALMAAKINGFVPASNYEELDTLIENLKLKSWQ